MAWTRRMSGIAGPLSASGEATNGNPVQVELYINGSWVDITAYVMVRDDSGNISITRGRRDEGSTAEQATCQLTLNNRDGRWSPRNPTGPYYGHLGRNQAIRVSVPNGLGGKSYRFQGEVSIWPQSWDPTGTDVWTDIEASGILRRLSQGPAPAYSVIREAVSGLSLDTLKAYWPCEDPEGSATIASALVNGSAMVFDGTPQLATFTQFGASDPLPTFTNAGMTGGVAKYDMTSVTEYQLRYLLAIPKGGMRDTGVISRLTFSDLDTIVYLDVHFNDPPGGLGSYGGPGTLTVVARDGDQAELALGGTQSLTMDARARLLLVSLEVSNNGANLAITLRALDLLNSIEDSCAASAVGSNVSRVLSVGIAPETLGGGPGASDTAVGHVMLQTDITPSTELGRSLQPSGETAGRRIQRLCDEQGIAFESIGDLDDTVAMGGQDRQNPLTVMQEAELADTGMLYESMPTLGLGYRTRASLTNQDAQLTLNYTGFNLSEIPTPVEDDRYIQNQVTVTVNDVSQTYAETSGALSTAVPPVGVGVYGEEVTLNLNDPGEALNQAAWRVHLGTVDEPRYPEISVNLAHSSFVSNPALKQAVLGLRQGDRIVIQNMPSWLPPGDVDQILLGFQETITHFEHRLTFVCAPASPYQVAVSNTALARIDTDGSELITAVDASETSLDVRPTAPNTGLWVTDSAEFPFDIRVGGEVMTVSAISPWLTDTFNRSVSSGWGTADSGQVWSVVGGSASDFAVSAGVATHTLTTTNVSRRSFIDTTFTEFDYYGDITVSATATGGSLYGALTGRYIDGSNLFQARLEFNTSGTTVLSLRRILSGTDTLLAQWALVDPYVAGTYYRVRFQVSGSTLRAKAWPATDAVETPEWQVTATDSSISSVLFFGTRSISDSANTNVNPVIRYQNLRIVNPQTFTVTRSVNGVSKSQVLGEDVRLAYPTFVSL
jgi:hypothetical protein